MKDWAQIILAIAGTFLTIVVPIINALFKINNSLIKVVVEVQNLAGRIDRDSLLSAHEHEKISENFESLTQAKLHHQIKIAEIDSHLENTDKDVLEMRATQKEQAKTLGDHSIVLHQHGEQLETLRRVIPPGIRVEKER